LRAIQDGLSPAVLERRVDPKRKQLFDDLSLRGDRRWGAASTTPRILHGKVKWRGPGFVFQSRVAAGSQEASHRRGTPGSDGAMQRSGAVQILGIYVRAGIEQKPDGLHLPLRIPGRPSDVTIGCVV